MVISIPFPRSCPLWGGGGAKGLFLQVLEVPAGELIVGNDLDLAVTLLGDLDGLAEVADATLNLDLLVQELLKSGDIEDLVAGRLGSVDDELGNILLANLIATRALDAVM